jgi:Flp pilus assembly protein TadD
VRLFYSYAHEDAPHREELEKHLASLQREGLISGWSDEELLPGADWRGEIVAALETADIVLLLVSADFISSDFIWNVEMQRALERHAEGSAIIIPVIVRPTDWKETLGFLQAVPTSGRPVTEWDNRDAAWVDVVSGIRRLVQRRREGGAPPTEQTGAGMTTQMLVEQGGALLWLGRSQEGAALLDSAIAKPPSDRDAFVARAKALMLRGRTGEALAAFNAALGENADDLVALTGRAQTQFALGRLREALADLDRVLKIDDRQPYAHMMRGLVLEAAGQPGKAKKDYDRAIKQEPNNVRALVFRGYLHGRQGNHNRAVSDFSRAIELVPNVVPGIVGRGWAYIMLKRYREALAEFQRALQLDPNNGLALNGQQEARRLADGTGHLKKLFREIFP